jgi:hypothetical protein
MSVFTGKYSRNENSRNSGNTKILKHYDVDSATGEAKILLASVYYLSKRLTHQEPKPEIDQVLDAKLRQLAENGKRKIAQTP